MRGRDWIDSRFLVSSLGPVVRQEGVDLGVLHARESSEDIGEILLGVNTPPATAPDDRVNDGTRPARLRMPENEPSLLADEAGAYRIFIPRLPLCREAERNRDCDHTWCSGVN